MSEKELNKFNESITLEEGKIYWRPNYNYTSNLWERLKREGWAMEQVRSFVMIYDNEGSKVVDEIGVIHALKSLADMFE